MTERITLKEFRAWLDGLLSGRDLEREALPTRDQWAKILAKIDAIEDPAIANLRAPAFVRDPQVDQINKDAVLKHYVDQMNKARAYNNGINNAQWLGPNIGAFTEKYQIT